MSRNPSQMRQLSPTEGWSAVTSVSCSSVCGFSVGSLSLPTAWSVVSEPQGCRVCVIVSDTELGH